MTNQIALGGAALFFCLWTGLLARFKGYSALCWFFAGGIVGLVILWRIPSASSGRNRRRVNRQGLILSALSLVGMLLLKEFL